MMFVMSSLSCLSHRIPRTGRRPLVTGRVWGSNHHCQVSEMKHCCFVQKIDIEFSSNCILDSGSFYDDAESGGLHRGRGRGRGFRGRGRGRGFRGRGQFTNTRGGAAAPVKKKLAMGRNVFCESDEEDDQHQEEEVADFKS